MAFTYAGSWGSDSITSPTGDPLPNYLVTVRNPDGSLATLYTDRTMATTGPNPVSTDSEGNLRIFAVPGDYYFVGSVATVLVTVQPDPADVHGWPTDNGAGAGNLVAQTDIGDSVGYSFTARGTGGFTAIAAGGVDIQGDGIALFDTGGGVAITARPGAPLTIAATNMSIATLPTTDPMVTGQLWDSNGNLVFSGYSTTVQVGAGNPNALNVPGNLNDAYWNTATASGNTDWLWRCSVAGVAGAATWVEYGAVGTGTVTNLSVVSANGLAGTVTNPTTTPAITLSTPVTGILKGNGTAISAATAGTDYLLPSGNGSGLTGITQSQVSGSAPLANPTFTGAVHAPTPLPDDNSTLVATTAYVQANTQYEVYGQGSGIQYGTRTTTILQQFDVVSGLTSGYNFTVAFPKSFPNFVGPILITPTSVPPDSNSTAWTFTVAIANGSGFILETSVLNQIVGFSYLAIGG